MSTKMSKMYDETQQLFKSQLFSAKTEGLFRMNEEVEDICRGNVPTSTGERKQKDQLEILGERSSADQATRDEPATICFPS